MEAFVERWARELAAPGATRNVQEEAGYVSDSSSDESVIPNARPPISFPSYNSSARKNKGASPSDGYGSDTNVEIIKSDLDQPVPQHSTAEGGDPQMSSVAPTTGPLVDAAEGKRTMSASNRERQSQIMKERWAAGRMSHVHEKIKETLKRKASLEGLGHDDDGDGDSDKDRPLKKTASAAHRSSLDSPSLRRLSRSQLELWEYLRPHLTVFRDKPPPMRNWVPEFLALPRVRDLKFNPRAQRKRPYTDTDDKSVAAMVLQLIGKLASLPCTRCSKGNGVFDGCVKLPPNAPVGSRVKNCANCWYSHQACTYETEAVPQEDNTVVDEDDFAREVNGEEGDLSEVEVQHRSGNTRQLDAGSMPKISQTLSGRSYREWPDQSGRLTTLAGNLLLPDGYKLNTKSGKPWTCPVDYCRRPFPHLKALSCHFPRVHYAQVLNDNLDGTFSALGLYDSPKLGNGGAYPKEPPSFPFIASRKAKVSNGQVSKPTSASAINPLPVRTPDSEEDEEAVRPSGRLSGEDESQSTWQYIKPHLKKTTTVPNHGWVKELLPLPRVRDLRFNPNRRSDFSETNPRDISCMIIQLTGEEAPSPCSKCSEGRGQFSSCVVISRDAPPEVRARMVSCANCNYHNRQSDCSIIKWVVGRQQPPWPGYLGRGGRRTISGMVFDPPEPASTSERPGVSDRRPSERRPPNDQEPAARSSSAPTPPAPTQTSGPAGDRNVKEITKRGPSPRREQPAVMPLRQPNPEEVLEMEDWEVAPGRIRFQGSETQDDLALSRAYLSSNKSAQVHNDLAVRIDVVATGSTLRFDPMNDKMRSCIVHSGKLRIKVDGEPEFAIGPLGQFKIPTGVACTVQNRLYIDSVLIVNTLTVYD